MIATVVDWGALLDVVLYSLGAGVGLTIAFSLAILGATRLGEKRRDERGTEAVAYGVLAIMGLGLSAAGIVFGIVVITSG